LSPACRSNPESKGGSESSVKVAKADLVPTEYNLLAEYRSFAELEDGLCGCGDRAQRPASCGHPRPPIEGPRWTNGRICTPSRQPPSARPSVSRAPELVGDHQLPRARYSVPDRLCDSAVWCGRPPARWVVTSGEGTGAKEVARHDLVGPGCASICDAHYTHRRSATPWRVPLGEETTNGVLGAREGARLYLVEAAAVVPGASRPAWPRPSASRPLHGRPVVEPRAWCGPWPDASPRATSARSSSTGPGRRCQREPPPEHSLAAGTAMWWPSVRRRRRGRGGRAMKAFLEETSSS